MLEQIKYGAKQIGLTVIKLVDDLPDKPSARIVTKQIIRSSAFIGATYRAVCRATSAPDFLNELKIVEQEADETIYRLEVLEENGLISGDSISVLKAETNEILSIIVPSINTVKNKSKIPNPQL
jgi:four helix bundle protein